MFLKLKDFTGDVLNESSILKLKGLTKNEFQNSIILKNDYEAARKEFFKNDSYLLDHLDNDKFEIRNYKKADKKTIDDLIYEHINSVTKKLKFKRIGNSKTNKIKEVIWTLKAIIE